MSQRPTFTNEEIYHVYNRGTDKRNIVLDTYDIMRFIESLVLFNTLEPIGSIFEKKARKKTLGAPTSKLVEILAFNLLDNHFHLLLKQVADHGVSKFMQRLAGGFTMYFNEKYNRNGVLFQGKFKSSHVITDARLIQLAAYINCNHILHHVRDRAPTWGMRSSLEQFTGKRDVKKAKMPVTFGVLKGLCPLGKTYLKHAFKNIQSIADERGVALDEQVFLDLDEEAESLGGRSSKCR